MITVTMPSDVSRSRCPWRS